MEVFTSEDAKNILWKRFVVVIGDSVQRCVYKDLVCLLQPNNNNTGYLSQKELKAKGELVFLGDKLLEGGELSDVKTGIKYREVRQYDTGTTLLKFYFVTRCYSEHVESVLNEVKTIQPHVIIMNSCLWDLHRYGPRGPETYRSNMNKLVEAVKKVIPKDGVFIWNATMPLGPKCKGGFLLPYYENIPSQEILEANFVASEAVRLSNFIFLNLHSTFSNQLHLRALDGIHWNSIAHRRISNLILHQLCRVWNHPVPSRLLMEPLLPPTPPFGERPLSRSFSFDSNLERYSPKVYPYSCPVSDRRYVVERTLEEENASNYRDRFRLISTPVSTSRISSSFNSPNCSGFDPKKGETCSAPLLSSSAVESSSKTQSHSDVSGASTSQTQLSTSVVQEPTSLTGTPCFVEIKTVLCEDKPLPREEKPLEKPLHLDGKCLMPDMKSVLLGDTPSSYDVKHSEKQSHMNPSVTRGLLGDKPSILGDRPSPFSDKPVAFGEKCQLSYEDQEDEPLIAKSEQLELKPLLLEEKPSVSEEKHPVVQAVNKENNSANIEEKPSTTNKEVVVEEKRTTTSEEKILIEQELVEDKATETKESSTVIIIEKKPLPFEDGLAIVSSLYEDKPPLVKEKLSLSGEEHLCHVEDKPLATENKSIEENQVSCGGNLTSVKNITNKNNIPTVNITSPPSATIPNGMEAYPTGNTPPDMASNTPQTASLSMEEACHVTSEDDDIAEEHLRQMLLVSQQVNRELKKSQRIKNERVMTATCSGKSLNQTETVDTLNCSKSNIQYMSTSVKTVKENDKGTSANKQDDMKHTSTDSCEIAKKITTSKENGDDKSGKIQNSGNKNTVKNNMKDISRSNDRNTSRGIKRKVTIMPESSPRNKQRKAEDKRVFLSKCKIQCPSTSDVPLAAQATPLSKNRKRKASDCSSQSKCAKHEEQEHGLTRKVIIKSSVSNTITTQSNTDSLPDRSKSSPNQLSAHKRLLSSKRNEGSHITQNAAFTVPKVPQNSRSKSKHQRSNSMSIPVVSHLQQQYPMSNSIWTGTLGGHAINPLTPIARGINSSSMTPIARGINSSSMTPIARGINSSSMTPIARGINSSSMTQQQIAQQQLMFNMALHRRSSFPPVNPYVNQWGMYRGYQHGNQRY